MFQLFRKITPVQYAKKELEEAEDALLMRRLDIERLSSLIAYNEVQIERLKKFIKKHDVPEFDNEPIMDAMRGATL